MIREIKEALENLQIGPVKYGRMKSPPADWNYIVFARDRMKRTGTTGNDFNRYYTVAIVHEDYIPEDLEKSVIIAMKQVKGLRLANDDIQYDYMVKSNSDTVVEMAVITFTEPLKGYEVCQRK